MPKCDFNKVALQSKFSCMYTCITLVKEQNIKIRNNVCLFRNFPILFMEKERLNFLLIARSLLIFTFCWLLVTFYSLLVTLCLL